MDLPTDAFTVRRKIRFGQSDPAGIVFFPEFFRMFNDLFEDWVRLALAIDFAAQFRDHARMFPLVHVEADFKESRGMGQTIDLTLVLDRLGDSSIRYTIYGHDGGREILRAACVTCLASKETGRKVSLPDDMRGKMEGYLALCGEGGEF